MFSGLSEKYKTHLIDIEKRSYNLYKITRETYRSDFSFFDFERWSDDIWRDYLGSLITPFSSKSLSYDYYSIRYENLIKDLSIIFFFISVPCYTIWYSQDFQSFFNETIETPFRAPFLIVSAILDIFLQLFTFLLSLVTRSIATIVYLVNYPNHQQRDSTHSNASTNLPIINTAETNIGIFVESEDTESEENDFSQEPDFSASSVENIEISFENWNPIIFLFYLSFNFIDADHLETQLQNRI